MAVMIVEDDDTWRDTVAEVIEREGHTAVAAADADSAIRLFREKSPDVALVDYKLLPGKDGLYVLKEIRELDPNVQVIMMTGHGTKEIASEALFKHGARDYITKPVGRDVLGFVIRQSAFVRELHQKNVELQKKLDERDLFKELVGQSEAMDRVRETIRQVGATNATVLIEGESGTGKELVADAVHAHSERADKSLVKVAVAALPRELLESELFGHEKGSFTGAHKRRRGRFELADGGTLFLDEIGEMPLETQVKLLRVIESLTFERVGGTETLECDIRLVCATNRDLAGQMKTGAFRDDLYFRINVLSIKLPPLRDRREDIPLLVDHFVKLFARPESRIKRFSKTALQALAAYDWPGNVRELRNVVERLSITSPGEVVGPEDLPEVVRSAAGTEAAGRARSRVEVKPGMTLRELEKEAIGAALEAEGGNKTQTAKSLGIGLKTLYRKIKEYGI